MFKKSIQAAVLGMALIAAPFSSYASGVDAATKDKLTADLTAQGYEVRKFDAEDGFTEVYAVKDGQKWEFYYDDAMTLVKSCNDGTCEGVAVD